MCACLCVARTPYNVIYDIIDPFQKASIGHPASGVPTYFRQNASPFQMENESPNVQARKTPSTPQKAAAPLSARKAGMSARNAAEDQRRAVVAEERTRRLAEKESAAEKAKKKTETIRAILKRSNDEKAAARRANLEWSAASRKTAAEERSNELAARSADHRALRVDTKESAASARAAENAKRLRERSAHAAWQKKSEMMRSTAAAEVKQLDTEDRHAVATFRSSQHARIHLCDARGAPVAPFASQERAPQMISKLLRVLREAVGQHVGRVRPA